MEKKARAQHFFVDDWIASSDHHQVAALVFHTAKTYVFPFKQRKYNLGYLQTTLVSSPLRLFAVLPHPSPSKDRLLQKLNNEGSQCSFAACLGSSLPSSYMGKARVLWVSIEHYMHSKGTLDSSKKKTFSAPPKLTAQLFFHLSTFISL